MARNRNFVPVRPTGEGAFIRFCQAVWDEVFGPASQPIDTPTAIITQTTKGWSVKAKPQRGGAAAESHPFTITQGDTWLDFNVSPGYVITTGAPFLPTGITELDGTLHPHTITSPFTNFYVVLAILSPSTAAVSTSSTLPSFSTELIPIGWVDTSTYSADTPPKSVIYQFWRDNVFSPCVA